MIGLVKRGSKPTAGVEVEVNIIISITSIIMIMVMIVISIASIIMIMIIIILRDTHWLHVPRGPNEDVPAVFWDKQPLRELLQYAWHGLKPTPGCSTLPIVLFLFQTTSIIIYMSLCFSLLLTFCCSGLFQRQPCRWNGYRRSFCWVGHC